MNYKMAMVGTAKNPGPASDVMTTATTSDQIMTGNSLQLTAHKLNGKNYLEWAQTVRLVIDGRGKLGHLTGEIAKPEEKDASFKAWRSENSMVIAWLVNSMEAAIGKPFLYLPTAKGVWEAVRDTYSDLENSSLIFEIKTRLWNNKQGDRDLTTYYNEMLTLWQELDLCYNDQWEQSADSIKVVLWKPRLRNLVLVIFPICASSLSS